MPRYAYISEGTALPAAANGFPCFMADKRLKRIITADIWAFLAHETRLRLKGDLEKRGIAFLEQAQDFYRTAEMSADSSRPILYYYAYLNLAKVFILHKGVDLPAKISHGIHDPKVNLKQRLHFKTQQVHIQIKNGAVKHDGLMLPTLLHHLDATSVRFFGKELRVLDVMQQLPAIHRTYSFVTDTTEKFVPVASFTPLRANYEVWCRVAIKKTAATEAQINALMGKADFVARLVRVSSHDASENAAFWFFETPKVHYAPNTLDRCLGEVAASIREAGVWAVATPDGYRYYFNTLPIAGTLPQLGASVAVMFYFGSITRYKPYDFDKIEEKYAWLMSEFLSTDPAQVLYLLASKLAKTEVVAPYALGHQ